MKSTKPRSAHSFSSFSYTAIRPKTIFCKSQTVILLRWREMERVMERVLIYKQPALRLISRVRSRRKFKYSPTVQPRGIISSAKFRLVSFPSSLAKSRTKRLNVPISPGRRTRKKLSNPRFEIPPALSIAIYILSKPA